MEVVIALSPVDAGIGCWDLYSGAEYLRYRSCPSAPHGLNCVGRPFLASSQLRDTSLSSGSILYWSRNKPQVEVKSFPAEPINPFVSNSEGTYLMGGGIYFWVVSSGRLLKRWHAHYRAATCLVLSEDESLLISGAEDGCVRVLSLLMMLGGKQQNISLNIVSLNTLYAWTMLFQVMEDAMQLSCLLLRIERVRVWSLSQGNLLRTIEFLSIIDAVVLDPGEQVFYAGIEMGRYQSLHLMLKAHLIAVMGSISLFHCLITGPINNVFIIQQQLFGINRKVVSAQAPLFRRAALSLPPPLNQYLNSSTENNEPRAVIAPEPSCDEPLDATYHSFHVMKNQIHELQQQRSSAATEMELESLKFDCKRSLEMVQ